MRRGWLKIGYSFPPPYPQEVTSRARGREGGESGSKKRHGFGIITATLFTYRLVYCRRGCWDSICVNSNKTCSHGSRIGNRHLPRVWNPRTTYLQEEAMGGAGPSSGWCSSARQIKHPSLEDWSEPVESWNQSSMRYQLGPVQDKIHICTYIFL